jgi:type IV secretion system protein VirB5
MRKSLLIVVVLLCGAQARAGGIPVFDGVSLAKLQMQYQQLVQQYQELSAMHKAMTGSRGIAGKLISVVPRDYLPVDWWELEQIMNGSKSAKYGAIANVILKVKAKYQTVDCSKLGYKDKRLLDSCEQSQREVYTYRGLGEEAYRNASLRIVDINAMINAINQAKDPKAIAEVQARIAGEQAMLQNEAIKLQTVAMLKESQLELKRQQAEDFMRQRDAAPAIQW